MPTASLGAGTMDPENVVLPNAPVIVAATTIGPNNIITRIVGTTAIATITPPSPYFNGPLWLFSTDSSPFTTVTTGNIALATTVVRFKALGLIFDPAVSKWYPTY